MQLHVAAVAMLLACGFQASAMRADVDDLGAAQQDALLVSSLKAGSVLFGRFRLLRTLWSPAGYTTGVELGKGEFGIAYEAVDTKTKAKVVLKVFTDEKHHRLIRASSNSDSAKKRLEAASQECDASRALIKAGGNTRFMACLENGVDNADGAYIVLEHVPGETLTEWSKNNDEQIAGDLTLIMHMMLEGLAGIEGKFVHRDIKGDNVMVWRDADQHLQLKFIDFGLVTEAGLEVQDLAGAPGSQPPEMYKDQQNYKPGSPWDVWAVGMTMYQMICESGPAEMQKVFGQFPTAVAAQLLKPDFLKDECEPYEMMMEDDVKALLDFILANILVEEKKRAKASELLKADIFNGF